MATQDNSTLNLSRYTQDEVLRAFFQRGERDSGFVEPAPVAPVLTGGEACELEFA